MVHVALPLVDPELKMELVPVEGAVEGAATGAAEADTDGSGIPDANEALAHSWTSDRYDFERFAKEGDGDLEFDESIELYERFYSLISHEGRLQALRKVKDAIDIAYSEDVSIMKVTDGWKAL